jgi:Zn-dependent protease
MIRAFVVQGIPIFVHWSVLAIAGVILVVNWRDLGLALAAGTAYLSVLAIHELGHALVARKFHCAVHWIKIYPIHGLCWHDDAGSERRNGLIAWGGVLAQAVVAAPLLAFLAIFGYTPFEPANAVLVILGIFSTGWALFNLLPYAPLDGAKAWSALRVRSPLRLPRRSRRRSRRNQRKGLRAVR